MGDGGYSNPIIGTLGALIRDWIRSRNFVTHLAGWQISANGNAEFNDVTVRGIVDVGGAPNPEVIISADPTLGQAAMTLYTHGAGETKPGAVYASFTSAVELAIFLFSPEHNGDGQIDLALVGPENPRINTFYPARNTGGRFDFNNPSPGLALASFNDGTGVFIDDLTDAVGLAANLIVPLQIGLWTGTNLRLGADQIQAASNGVAAPLFINFNGGNVQIGGGTANGGLVAPRMTGSSGLDTTARATASTAYVTAGNTSGFTIPYPPSGNVLVMGNAIANNAGGQSLLDFEIRDTNAGGTLRRAASDTTSGRTPSAANDGLACMAHVTGLPTTGTMFCQAMVRASAGTANYDNLHVIAIPLP